MTVKFKFLPRAENDIPAGDSEELTAPDPTVPEGYVFRYPCPCCGEVSYPAPPEEAVAYICPVCFWENDVFIRSDDEPSDENGGMSLNDARREYQKYGIVRRELVRRKYTLLLFDLDGTLLRDDGTVSERNLEAIRRVRRARLARIGVATSRSEKNAAPFLEPLRPDVLISSDGARVRAGERTIFSAPFTLEEAGRIIETAREIAGPRVPMDADTPDTRYRGYPIPEQGDGGGYEDRVDTDFSAPPKDPLMFCVRMPDAADADRLRRALPFADVKRFANGDWYKLTRKGVTKGSGMEKLCEALPLTPKNIVAFGDGLTDVEMLRLSGLGVAMRNAVPEARSAAGAVIGDNNSDAIAAFLDGLFGLNLDYRRDVYA